MFAYSTHQRLQRKCACDHHAPGAHCSKCRKGNSSLQTKLSIGAAHDSSEQEADRVADQVMSGSASALRPGPQRIQRQPVPGGAMQTVGIPASVAQTLSGGGKTLDSSTRGFMEQRFGHDFSRVRVHTGTLAERSAQEVNARAYTVGSSIVFGAGRYDPGSSAGRHLLAHELAHVVQQGSAEPTVLQRDPVAEKEVNTIPTECTGKKDITEDLHDLIRDLDSLLAADTISDEQRKWLKFWCKEFWSDEGAAHPLGLSFVSCDQIHLNLLMTGENADSYIDPEHNELGLLASNANLIHSFRKNKKPEDLVRLLQLLMHEKRHLSLGRDLKVASGGLKPGRDIAAAGQAEYRAQEILTTAEELMVARSTLGSEFLVETGVQFKLFRLRNMIRGFVTEQEFKRLRGIIITKLRERYGFTNGCDSSITLGVLTAMERNDWYSCDREKGRVATPIPEGLNICENTLCRTKSSAGTGK